MNRAPASHPPGAKVIARNSGNAAASPSRRNGRRRPTRSERRPTSGPIRLAGTYAQTQDDERDRE